MTDPRIIIVGGGISGIAAALRLAEHGRRVLLLERRDILGGRASSFDLGNRQNWIGSTPDDDGPATPLQDQPAMATTNSPGGLVATDLIDNCQHVLMRCCVNLLDFYERIGAADAIRFYSQFLFIDPAGRESTLGATSWLPAPIHLLPSFFRFRSMTLADKVAIASGMFRLTRLSRAELQDHSRSFGEWLAAAHQTHGAIEAFWRPAVVSALNEEPDRTAAPHAFQLFRLAFLQNRRAYETGIPIIGLAELYSTRGGQALRRLGVEIRSGCQVERIEVDGRRVRGVVADGEALPADTVVSAVSHTALRALLDPATCSMGPFSRLDEFETSPIIGIHLWFDEPVMPMPHISLIGSEMHWIFRKDNEGKVLGLVVSASRGLASRSRAEILDLALAAVHGALPSSRNARLARGVVIRERHATFSPCLGIEALRPEQRTPVQGLYIAGDWARTGWPATMESAVRGGYLAAEALLQDQGLAVHLLAAEMPVDWLPRMMGMGK